MMIHIAIFVVILASTTAQSQSPPCHLMDVDICVSHLVGFTDERAGPRSEQVQYQKQCSAIQKSDTCLRNYTRVCATPPQRQMFNLMFDGIRRIHYEYCREGSELRESYVKHVPCLRSVVRDPMNPCMKDLQLMAEVITESPWTGRIDLTCCSYHRVGQCMRNQIERACGDESADFVQNMLRKVAGRILEIRCRDFTQRNQACRRLPPFGTNPKGGKSTSVINKLIRTYTSPAS